VNKPESAMPKTEGTKLTMEEIIMNTVQEKAIRIIEQQQKGIENTAPWMVGEQLKDICRREPHNAEIIAQDLTVADMSLVYAEKKLKQWADRQKRSGNSVCVPPNVAEGILREFYKLKPEEQPDDEALGVALNLSDFL